VYPVFELKEKIEQGQFTKDDGAKEKVEELEVCFLIFFSSFVALLKICNLLVPVTSFFSLRC
jgi:hypothetical protein